MLIDVFPFFDEIDLLEIRLHTLDPIVDKFVISEFSTTFAGNPKDYIFAKNAHLFSKFEKKILYFPQEQSKVLSPFENDDFQKNSIKKLLLDVSEPNDLILFGDVDEIPSPESLLAQLDIPDHILMKHFAQQVSYGYLNLVNHKNSLESVIGEYPRTWKHQWLGSILTKRSTVENFQLSQLRMKKHIDQSQRIARGGWHFSYCGGFNSTAIDRLHYKLTNNAHQEFNSNEIFEGIEERLISGKDILGRKTKRKFFPGHTHAKFKINLNLTFLPNYVQENSARFQHLIL